MSKIKIFLATSNKKKISEIQEILSQFQEKNIEILSINDGIKIPEVIEDGLTFKENSEKKAKEISNFLEMITIADDSGLCVDALNGAPGIYSARFASENSEQSNDKKNNEKLVRVMEGKENRQAKFVCVITLAKPYGETFSFSGEIDGEIISESHGENGFGYDPYFYIPKYGKTLAEMPEKKKEISHRAIALKKLAEELDK
ncbi:MAG: XTP/dITP diphosphatase, partial [Fusobacteriaceae bacterium]